MGCAKSKRISDDEEQRRTAPRAPPPPPPSKPPPSPSPQNYNNAHEAPSSSTFSMTTEPTPSTEPQNTNAEPETTAPPPLPMPPKEQEQPRNLNAAAPAAAAAARPAAAANNDDTNVAAIFALGAMTAVAGSVAMHYLNDSGIPKNAAKSPQAPPKEKNCGEGCVYRNVEKIHDALPAMRYVWVHDHDDQSSVNASPRPNDDTAKVDDRDNYCKQGGFCPERQ